jgi:hypothetical protein
MSRGDFMKDLYVVFLILLWGMTSMVLAGDGSTELKNALLALHQKKITGDSSAISKDDLAQIVKVKKGIGGLLDGLVGQSKGFKDKSIDKAIGDTICEMIPAYKLGKKRFVQRGVENDSRFADVISWETARLDDGKFVFVNAQVNIGCSADTFVYGYHEVNGKWVKVFENTDPDFFDSQSGRCAYKEVSFGGNNKYFLTLNISANCQSNNNQVFYSVYKYDELNSKLAIVLGPIAKSAVVPDPETPYSVVTDKDGAVVKFIGDRDTDANNIWTEVDLTEVAGKIKETVTVKK